MTLSEVGEGGCEDDCCALAEADTTNTSVEGTIVVVFVAVGNADVAFVKAEEAALSLVVAVVVVEGGSTAGTIDGFPSRCVLILTSAGSCTVFMVVVGVGVALFSLPAVDTATGG